jgi:small subunit ribosomal protein S9
MAAPRKRATKKASETSAVEEVQSHAVPEVVAAAPEVQVVVSAGSIPSGRYLFATGRRKTAIANIRLFSGKGDSLVNKKPLDKYFSHQFLREEALLGLRLTGLSGQYYFTATVNGGGIQAQAGAVRHGISKALSTLGEEVKRVLKKNGLLTRDPREKERKKPGLKRARRAPQWAKR